MSSRKPKSGQKIEGKGREQTHRGRWDASDPTFLSPESRKGRRAGGCTGI